MNRRRVLARRALVCLILVLATALLAWRLVTEVVEPHLLLWLRPASATVQASSIAGTTLRLHSDTRPHIGKISGLQKGLVWVRGRRSLVQEGYGFGSPIIEHQGRAYVSRTAMIETVPVQGGTRLIKHFEMNTVDTPIRFLQRKYRPVPSLGTVSVQYDVYPDGVVDVKVDFSQLRQEWSRAYLMNEQGARLFVRYKDDSGLELEADEIGIWQKVDGRAHHACLSTKHRDLEFCIEPEEAPTVYYGRERYWQRNWRGLYYLSWAGADIELDSPRQTYRYRIMLEAK